MMYSCLKLSPSVKNNSYIFMSQTYPKVLDNIRHHYQGQVINRLDKHMVELLFEKTSAVHPEFGTDWMKYEELSYIETEDFPHHLLDAIAETALSMDECQDVWYELHVSLYLRDILVSYAQCVHSRSDEYIDRDCVGQFECQQWSVSLFSQHSV